MASQHGHRPPNPRNVPKSHGKRPSNPVTAPKQHGPKPPPKPPVRSGRSVLGESGSCCPMVAAVQSVKRGRFRLAARYARWSVRLITARVTA